MSATRPLKSTPLVSQEEREKLRRNSVRINRVFDTLNAYPGGFHAEFERRARQQGLSKHNK